MSKVFTLIRIPKPFLLAALLLGLAACAGSGPELPPASLAAQQQLPDYRIGPGDTLSISVFDNLAISDTVTVRPDGKITVSLVGDVPVAEKTPAAVAEDIEERLRSFVQDPLVTVIVTGFVGSFSQQVRVVGAAAEPRAILHRANMSALDVMIEVGGLTEFAAGPHGSGARRGWRAQTIPGPARRSDQGRRHLGQRAHAAGRRIDHTGELLLIVHRLATAYGAAAG